MRRIIAVGALLGIGALGAGRAMAHGTIPAPATFTNPPRLEATPTDGGDRAFAPYAFPVADDTFEIRWEDGDTDGLARHSFYYLDHAPSLAMSLTEIASAATFIPESGDGIWASCTCAADMGTCPDAGVRRCENSLVWNTSGVAPGAYWLIAITRDPPTDIYTVADGPVRVAHGATPPPAVIVVRPDGFGSFDLQYRVRWLLAGTPPFRVALSYAATEDIRAGVPFAPIATDVPLAAQGDASYGFDWDVASLGGARIYYVRAVVEDASGLSASSDSRAGVTVFHPGEVFDLSVGARSDLGDSMNDDGCSMSGRSGLPVWPSVLLGALMTAIASRRRYRIRKART